jgi:hypothetical protein
VTIREIRGIGFFMSDIAISVQNLSKHYTIGAAQQRVP